MKKVALVLSLVFSCAFVLEPVPASAGNTSRWIQLGLSTLNGARTLNQVRRSDPLSKVGLNPQPLPPKIFRRR